MPDPSRIPLPGSHKAAPHDAVAIGDVDPNAEARVTLYLRRRNEARFGQYIDDHAKHDAHLDRHHLSHEALCHHFGSSAEDVSQIARFAHQHGLQVLDDHTARRSVTLSGTILALSKAFGVELKRYRAEGYSFRGRQGAIHVPKELEGIVTSVLGFDDRPIAKPHFRVGKEPSKEKGIANARVIATSYDPRDVAREYNFPLAVTGQGECIALIELGGGYDANQVAAYFSSIGATTGPGVTPTVESVSVAIAQNQPGNDADYEVQLDIEVAGAVAPGAKLKVYFAPNSDSGFLDAITQAIHDPEVTLISISWGSATLYWTGQSLQEYNRAFQDAAALGKPVFVASGDDGSNDNVGDGKAHCDFPAASPYTVACGGTTLVIGEGSEVVWNELPRGGATGGGISGYFKRPPYQNGAGVPKGDSPWGGRGLPDVAGNADPQTGYRVQINGDNAIIGGTSAVSPLYAGLFALINEALRAHGKPRAGFVQPILYANAGAFRDITSGNNGPFYTARKGWDATTGLGSPDGQKILAAFLK
jgi:kumamolisin